MATKQKISRLTDIAATHSALDFPYLSKKSQDWLRAKVGQLKNPAKMSRDIAAERERSKGRPSKGSLYFMQYDPITKERLPYYDIFPLIILLEIDGTHFTGLNLHYLPPRYRAIMLDMIMDRTNYSQNDEGDVVRFTNASKVLDVAKNHPILKHCLKRYLIGQMQSKFLKVEPHEWETSLYLPVQQFQKAKTATVWADSLKSLKKGK